MTDMEINVPITVCLIGYALLMLTVSLYWMTKIKKAIAELTKEEPPETAPSVQIYTLDSITAASVLPVETRSQM